eukprot:1187624-Prorocentrum_minimum.AAC.1
MIRSPLSGSLRSRPPLGRSWLAGTVSRHLAASRPSADWTARPPLCEITPQGERFVSPQGRFNPL